MPRAQDDTTETSRQWLKLAQFITNIKQCPLKVISWSNLEINKITPTITTSFYYHFKIR